MQGYATVQGKVGEVEVWGLGGLDADEQQAKFQHRENLFAEQRRKASIFFLDIFFFLEISVHWMMAMISIITVEVGTGFLHVHKLFIATTQHTKDRTLCFIRYCKNLCLLHWSSLQTSGLSSGKTDLVLCKTFFFVSLSDCCKKN